MIEFLVTPSESIPSGRLVYRSQEYSFDFLPASPSEVQTRVGLRGSTSLAIGTLQLEFAIDSGAALYVWGYHPYLNWKVGRVAPIRPTQASLLIRPEHPAVTGISQKLTAVGEWSTVYDPATGVVHIDSGVNCSPGYVQFAAHTIAAVSDGKLVGLYLYPEYEGLLSPLHCDLDGR